MLPWLFYFFAIPTVGFALASVTAKHPIYSVLSLVCAFFNASALFIMLGAEFVAFALLIVYVGAVAVLFLFVVMMLNINKYAVKNYTSQHFWPLLCLGIFIFIEIVVIFYTSNANLVGMAHATVPQNDLTNTHQIGLVLYTKYGYLFQLSGVVLFTAIIASIVLAGGGKILPRKRQNYILQMARTKDSSVELVKPELGKGVGDA